jgi:hypothetical protein
LQKDIEEFIPQTSIETDNSPSSNPLLEQIIEARENGDMDRHAELIEEWKNQQPAQQNNLPEVINVNPQEDPSPSMRWGPDVTIYSGDVLWNSWSVLNDVDDEAISVDYYNNDTLRAAVACTDSMIRIFVSGDGGANWSYEHGFYISGQAIYEPEIIHGSDGAYYHVLCRPSGGNGNLLHVRYEPFAFAYIETADDTVANFTFTTDRTSWMTYYLYVAYHQASGGLGADDIYITRSLDDGTTWETPSLLQVNGSGFPDFTFGTGGHLYESYYAYLGSGDRSIRSRHSADYGVNWNSSIVVFQDTTYKMGPQIAASHDGTGDVWVVFPMRDQFTANLDYGLRWSWSQDLGATWSSISWTNSWVDSNEVLPSISIHDGYYDSLYHPYITMIRSSYDWADPVVFSFNWLSDTTWSAAETYNDNVPAFTRPIQTCEIEGIPAMAYVGEAGVNVYYDAWSFGGVEEGDEFVGENDIITVHPNPFTSMARIAFANQKSGAVTIKAYNVLGQEVSTIFNGTKDRGNHILQWYGLDNSGEKLPSGVYFLKVNTPTISTSKKLILQ